VGGWLVVVTDEVTSNIIIFCEDGEQALDYLPLLTSSYLFFFQEIMGQLFLRCLIFKLFSGDERIH
jgi:hypothetical protein